MAEENAKAGEERCVRLFLQPHLSEVAKARELVDTLAERAGLSPARAFDAKVALSEACANGIEHARSSVRVVAWLLRDRVLFEVTNDGPFVPGTEEFGGRRRRGYGFPLMAALADQVHVSRLSDSLTRLSLTFLTWPPARVEPGEAPHQLMTMLAANRQMLDVAEAELMATRQAADEAATRHVADPEALAEVVASVSSAPNLRRAAADLLSWAARLTSCHAGLLRLKESGARSDGWIPAVAHFGLGKSFLAEEAVIRSDECMCGRVGAGLVDAGLPFFSDRGSFLWGRAQTIAQQFAAEVLGEVRGRCIKEGFESIAIFPIADPAAQVVGVLHLADFRKDRFADASPTLECACRICGPLMTRGRTGEQALLVRNTVAEYRRAV